MHVWIKGHDRRMNESVRAFVEARVVSTLSRVSKRVRAIQVSIQDVNGPRGGLDHLIRIVVHLRAGGRITVLQRAHDVRGAIPVALKRAVREVVSELQRRRTNRRNAHRRNLRGHSGGNARFTI